MKILIRNTDNVVLFAGDDLKLDAHGAVGRGWVAPFCTPANSRIEDAPLPAVFVGAAYSYADGVWTVIDQAAVDAAAPQPPTPPDSVPMWAAREVLIDAGLLASIEMALGAIANPTARAKAQSRWNHAAVVSRTDSWLITLAPMLGLSETALDGLFVAADRLARSA